jgi:hypothetical protein
MWSRWMADAAAQTPAGLGKFLTDLVAWHRELEPPDHGALLAVGMRAALAALVYTNPDEMGRQEQGEALAILQTALWIGWPTPRGR